MTPPIPPFVSVILCSYNPRRDYLQATLDSLRRQDLPVEGWELVVVDNNSSPPLADFCDVSWHPAARIVVESQQGLAHARRRGYREARGELIVHSDDDNVLAGDYLTVASRIHREHPHIGTFGGQLFPRFEVEPRNDLERSFGEERRFDRDHWSNLFDDTRTMPWGAGMCLRREVVEKYLVDVERDPRRLLLGRSGVRLMTGEDLDLNYVCVGLGLGTGRFSALSFEHFIPQKNMTPDFWIRYKGEANAYSVTILKFLHLGRIEPPPPASTRLREFLRICLRLRGHQRRAALSWRRGVKNAVCDMRQWGWLAD